jgi:hypothetical protein
VAMVTIFGTFSLRRIRGRWRGNASRRGGRTRRFAAIWNDERGDHPETVCLVMPALVAGIHVLKREANQRRGCRNKPGHDEANESRFTPIWYQRANRLLRAVIVISVEMKVVDHEPPVTRGDDGFAVAKEQRSIEGDGAHRRARARR